MADNEATQPTDGRTDSGQPAVPPTRDLTPREQPVIPNARAARKRIHFTSDLPGDLTPSVRELALALRMLADCLNTSMTLYAASLHRCASTLSRYFSGQEMPGADFVERPVSPFSYKQVHTLRESRTSRRATYAVHLREPSADALTAPPQP